MQLAEQLPAPIGGFLYGVGIEIGFTPLAWWSSALVAILGAIQVFFMRRQKDVASVKGLTHHMSKDSLMEPSEGPHRQVVHITIDTIPEESEGSSDQSSSRSSIIEDADEETGLLQR